MLSFPQIKRKLSATNNSGRFSILMKKTAPPIVIVLMLFCVAVTAEAQKPFKILTSFYPMYIMAFNVAKDVPGVTVENLAPPATDGKFS